MTATSSTRPRKRFRLAAMESLGFSEAPFDSSLRRPASARTTLVTTRPAPKTGKHVEDLWDSTELHAPALVDWKPSSTSKRLHKRNFRLTVVLGTLVVLVGAAAFAYWIYQRPVKEAAIARAAVAADATDLSVALEGVAEVVVLLPSPHIDNINYSTILSLSDDAARNLFASSADLTQGSALDRATATDVAGIALDISRTTGHAMAYRLALEPALTLPVFETDPGLIDLVGATEEFGAWWARFDEIVTALPQGVVPDVTDSSTTLLADLESWQAGYVDAIRVEDAPAAAAVLAELQAELDKIHAELLVSSEALSAEVSALLAHASQRLASLVG